MMNTPDNLMFGDSGAIEVWQKYVVHPLVTHQTVQQELLRLHSRKQDFDEGNLLHRLNRFNAFSLQPLQISKLDLEEFNLDQEKVDEFKSLYLATNTYPPIIFDAIDGSIIDGTHRANALAQLGVVEINAYVGNKEHLDLEWSMDDDQDEDDDF